MFESKMDLSEDERIPRTSLFWIFNAGCPNSFLRDSIDRNLLRKFKTLLS